MESLQNIGTTTIAAVNTELLESYLAYIDRKPTTMKGYVTCLRQFAQWIADTNRPRPQRADIAAYRDYLTGAHFGRTGEETLKAGTQQQYLRAVKNFFKWTAAEGLYPNIAENIHGAQVDNSVHKKDALDREGVRAVAAAIDRSTETGKRLYAMFLLCVTCGTRTIELNRANVEDIKRNGDRTYIYLQGKGKDEHSQAVLLPEEVQEAVRDYLAARTDSYTGKSPLFVGSGNRSHGKRIATTTISTMLKDAMKTAGYDSDRLTAHSLRHSSGTAAYKATGNIYLAQKHQRHADPKTTEIYVHAEEREQRNTEEQVYSYYFSNDEQHDPRQEAYRLLQNVSPDKLEAVCAYLKAINGL